MRLAIVGGGPAGLRAAEIAAAAGAAVTLFEGKPSVGRKFLVAGRGGLNLTKSEPADKFAAHYLGNDQPPGFWNQLLEEHEPVREWALGLGIETFVASSGRVYPKEMKAAPLLRRWVARLRALGVEFRPNHRWTGLVPMAGGGFQLRFANGAGHECDSVILALGGASWPESGSDAGWTSILGALGVTVVPWQPANCGWELEWPREVLERAEGQPLKNIVARVGSASAVGELMITRYGLEGGAIYQLGPALRGMREPALTLDLKPSHTAEQLVAKMGPVRRNLLVEARGRWRLSPAAEAILAMCGSRAETVEELSAIAKACALRLSGPRPIAEAISSAGGVAWRELDETLMVRRLPGLFVAGEMIDWEAPTGGYLIHGCLATGARAALGALRRARRL